MARTRQRQGLAIPYRHQSRAEQPQDCSTRREQTLEIWDSDEDNEGPKPAWMIDADAVDAQERLEKTESSQLLQQLIKELPEDKRDIFLLLYESETGVRGAAEILGIPEGTVKSRLHYTMKQLTKAWYTHQNNLNDLQD